MNERGGFQFMFACLLLAVAALLYLDWRRQGEIDLLAERVSALDTRARARPEPVRPPSAPAPHAEPLASDPLPGAAARPATAAPGGTNEPHPLVRAVLQAHTDAELDRIAKEQQ